MNKTDSKGEYFECNTKLKNPIAAHCRVGLKIYILPYTDDVMLLATAMPKMIELFELAEGNTYKEMIM